MAIVFTIIALITDLARITETATKVLDVATV